MYTVKNKCLNFHKQTGESIRFPVKIKMTEKKIISWMHNITEILVQRLVIAEWHHITITRYTLMSSNCSSTDMNIVCFGFISPSIHEISTLVVTAYFTVVHI